ncbi:MAG TPA: MBL fold metallo-hydrolase, partial [Planctomycetia bacterium]|nr:MBL fold metallo-hydrolase [Planctomycetia bacterium]
MQITFLGGAEEVGASCAALDIDGARVLIDCGQRLGAGPGEALPDFSLLEEGPPITAVLVTHAHADHIGALPALEPFLPEDCPIYATDATIALARVMLQDSVRIMKRFRSDGGSMPLFAPASVAPALERFQAVRWGKAVRLSRSPELFATWFPSGHILGAGMIEIKSKRCSALFSGDVSVADQIGVPGVFAPSVRPEILVLESTYGNRLHAHRPSQEKRIVERVKETIAAGGSVLFPTFALGRAQEVLLLLGKAMRSGALPALPVFADGLVRAISKVYRRLTDDLSPWCRQLADSGLDPIFPEDLPIRPVKDERQREQIVAGSPCAVVASSGMLQGGASAFYARHWLGDARNLVVLTGYQDEESPGQALLNLAADGGERRVFKLAGQLTEVRCQVESAWLSAHADNGELLAFASKLQPKLILPVHGDEEAREGLARSLTATLKSKVILPHNGETLSLDDL